MITALVATHLVHAALGAQLDPRQIVLREIRKLVAKAIGTEGPFQVAPASTLESLLPTHVGNFNPIDVTRQAFVQIPFSKGGELSLPPGDYTIHVDTFCMKAGASSPLGHRYELTRAGGKLAVALVLHKSRAAFLGLSHGETQVVSWALQAGTPLDKLSPAYRKNVDLTLPEYEKSMGADPLHAALAKYGSLRHFPGVPSFDKLLDGMGEVGRLFRELVEQQSTINSPSATVDGLLARYMPALQAFSELRGGTDKTPWSRLGSGAVGRLVTSGGAGSPAVLQLHVTGEKGKPVAVPLAGVVANSASASIQTIAFAPQNRESLLPCLASHLDALNVPEARRARILNLYDAALGFASELGEMKAKYLETARAGGRDVLDSFPLVYYNVTAAELQRLVRGDSDQMEAKLTDILYFYRDFDRNRQAFLDGRAMGLSDADAATKVEAHWRAYYGEGSRIDAADPGTAWMTQIADSIERGLDAHIDGDLARSLARAFSEMPPGTSWNDLRNDFMRTDDAIRQAYDQSMGEIMGALNHPETKPFVDFGAGFLGESKLSDALSKRHDAWERAQADSAQLLKRAPPVDPKLLARLRTKGTALCRNQAAQNP